MLASHAQSVEYSPLPLSLFLRLPLTRSDLYHHSNPFSLLLSHIPFCTSSDHKAHPRALAPSLYTFLFYPSPHSFSSLLLHLPPSFSLTSPDPSPILIPSTLLSQNPVHLLTSYAFALLSSPNPLPSLPFHSIPFSPPHSIHPTRNEVNQGRAQTITIAYAYDARYKYMLYLSELLGGVICERRGWWSANREIAFELPVAASPLATYVLWLSYVDTRMI